MFADKVQIKVAAGMGGNGKMSFRHEKYRAKGGPDGGDGGHGASVVFEVSHNLNTLSHFKNQHTLKADDGDGGGGNRRRGKSGEDMVVMVPMGTIVYEGEKRVADLSSDGQSTVIAKGGRGGFGNAHFVSSTRQAPRAAELGEAGEEKALTLELKLVADVGLVGLPNAGKSTLLSVISNAKPDIGDYPFTTLIPNLGMVDFEQDTFMVADIPGLIEGASEGKGLGDEFLRHVERTAVLLHLIDINTTDLVADYKVINRELTSYQVDLSSKPRFVVITKIETAQPEVVEKARKLLVKASGLPVFAVSAVAHRGLDEVLREATNLVQVAREERQAQAAAELPVIDSTTDPNLWSLDAHEDGMYVVSGGKIEGFARRTDWSNPDSVERLYDILGKQGILGQLRKQQVAEGAIIQVADHRITFRG